MINTINSFSYNVINSNVATLNQDIEYKIIKCINKENAIMHSKLLEYFNINKENEININKTLYLSNIKSINDSIENLKKENIIKEIKLFSKDATDKYLVKVSIDKILLNKNLSNSINLINKDKLINELEALKTKNFIFKTKKNKEEIKLLNLYNKIKDIGNFLFEKIANISNESINNIYERYEISKEY